MESTYGVKDVDTQALVVGLAKTGDEHWAKILKIVSDKYPYCTMHGVHVEEGCIVAYEGVQISFVFGEGVAAAAIEPAFDGNWQALKSLCAKIGFGRLAEIRFSRGRPVGAKMTEGGRRLRRLAAKDAPSKGRTPMS
jgi:hypothetical protein